jgi:hypothetical protein
LTPQFAVADAVSTLDPDWIIVTLLASEKNGADVEMVTDDSSIITCELLTEIE